MEHEYSFDLANFDFDAIHQWLSNTYWSPGIARAKVEQGFRASTLCIGAFDNGVQIGAARCISDTTRFGYIADVYVREDRRNRGIARELVRRMMVHDLVKDVEKWYLLTLDAQQVYEGLGFRVFPHPERFMVCKNSSEIR